MSFAIEVPAEANPLTSQTLYNVIQSASSNNQQQIQTGTKQLQNWEKSPGFYSSLQSLYIDLSLPTEIRYLSIIQVKNGIDKYWRKTALNAISKEEKSLIRSRCAEAVLKEPDARLALQAAIVVARIIRYEYPHDWSDAISSLVANLHSAWGDAAHNLRLSRSLLTLLYVVSELSTARLQRSRASLQSAAPSIAATLFAVYRERVEKWIGFLQNSGDDEGGALNSMEQSLLAMRVVRRLIISGYEFPNRHQELRDIWETLTSQFGIMLALVQADSLQPDPREMTEKHLLQISKLHLDMANNHPAAYALLPGSMYLTRSYWDLAYRFSADFGLKPAMSHNETVSDGDKEDEDETSLLEELTLKGLLLFRACHRMAFNPASTFKYQHAQDKEEKNFVRELIKKDLLTEDFARQIMTTLVIRFFVFTARDLRQWEEEPDEWEKSQEGADDWEFSVRTCAEKLFLDIVISYKELLVPYLLETISTAANSQDTNNVLLKDSMYAAIGLAAPVLDQRFDFGTFLESTLAQEAQLQLPGYNILRRRTAIVLGQWLQVKEELNRPLVYGIFQHLLDKDDPLNDQVVRVTAGRNLHNVIDPFEFTADGFKPYAPAILDRLMALIQEIELPETKLALLNTISIIVVKMEHHITPFAVQILSLLPPLWTQAGDEYLMKQSILGILSALITSLQADSQEYHVLVIPLIRSSIEPTSESRSFLLEDALDLWAAVLEQTPSPASPEIVSLVQYLFPMFDIGSDALRKALEITESYIYLIPAEILSNATVLLTPFSSLLGTLKRDSKGVVTHLVELLIRSAHNLGGLPAVQELTPALLSSSFLPALLDGLHDAFKAHETTGPNRLHPSIDGIVETDYLSVLARLAVASPSLLISAIDAARPNEPIDWLLTEWFSHMDSIGHPAQKKLSCLALTSLLKTGQPWILSRLQSLMTIWTDIITELVVEEEDSSGNTIKRDYLIQTTTTTPNPDSTTSSSPSSSPASLRHSHLHATDPIYTIDIRDHVRSALGAAIAAAGGMDPFRERWVSAIDADVVAGFGALGIL